MTLLLRLCFSTSSGTELKFIANRFSLSKWIHIHNGDSGLTKFFERVYSVLNPGGFFVLEPQSWESYAKARRMDPVCLKLCQFVCSPDRSPSGSQREGKQSEAAAGEFPGDPRGDRVRSRPINRPRR